MKLLADVKISSTDSFVVNARYPGYIVWHARIVKPCVYKIHYRTRLNDDLLANFALAALGQLLAKQ